MSAKALRNYQVWLEGMERFIEVQAADVEVSAAAEGAPYWNFFVTNSESTTVAAFPFDVVEYIISVT